MSTQNTVELSLDKPQVSMGKSCLRIAVVLVLSPLALLFGVWLISLLGMNAPQWIYSVGFVFWLVASAGLASLVNRIIK